jgi:cellulose synthase/poly-beta-1,6-N-acetylglucosamine synthase-like glycosyltransferase
MKLSVVICAHNPRPPYLARVLDALAAQTLPKEEWELLLVDNGSEPELRRQWDLSWHPLSRHIYEVAAYLRGRARGRGREATRDAIGVDGSHPVRGRR